VNISASWQATSKLHLAAGVDNVFDEKYDRHLGGYNRAANPDISKGNRLSGTGSNLFVRAEWSF
jgi:iron complex outermembrane receptor protein